MKIRDRNRLLIAGSVVALILCHKLAFSETFAVKGEYDRLKREQVLFGDIPAQKALLGLKKKRYDSLLRVYQVTGTSLQNGLLKTIDRYVKINGIELVEFGEPHVVQQGELSLTNYMFTVSGDFNALLALAHHLEQRSNFGSMVGLGFENVRDFKKRQTRLEAHIIMEIVK